LKKPQKKGIFGPFFSKNEKSFKKSLRQPHRNLHFLNFLVIFSQNPAPF
jgi:hypothetical protein